MAEASSAKRNILITTLILTVITGFEFALAFTDAVPKNIKLITYIIMTIVKAYFIIGNFMHLKEELKKLIASILLPFVFLIWLLIALSVEGDYWAVGKDPVNGGLPAATK